MSNKTFMRRESFLVGASNVIAAGGTFILSGATNSDDALVRRFRAGDYLATSYAHMMTRGGSNFATPVSGALAAIRAGSNAELIATLFSDQGIIACLYRVLVDNYPVRLLLAGTADGLTDIGAFPDSGGMPGEPAKSQDRGAHGDNSGNSWAVYDALSLVLCTVWPTSELESGLSMTNYSKQAASISFQTTRALWEQSDDAAQAHILMTLGSAAARLYGVLTPDTATARIEIGVRETDVTRTSASTIAQEGHDEQAFLAQRTMVLRRWSKSPVGPS